MADAHRLGGARHLVQASLGQGFTTVFSAVVSLFTAPFLIHRLGPYQYGVFGLITIVSSYLTNLEFGFGHATIRFLARASAAGNDDEAQAVFSTGFLMFIVGALTGALLTFLGSGFIVHTFAHGPASLRTTFMTAIRIAAGVIATLMLTTFVSAALQARGYYRVLVVGTWYFGTLLSLATIAIVALGGGLVDIIWAQLATYCLTLLAYFFILRRYTTLRLDPRPNGRVAGSMARFGAWVTVAGVTEQVLMQSAPAILAGYKTTAEVAAFAVPSAVMQQLLSLSGATALAFLPFISAASLDNDLSVVKRMYVANLRLSFLILAPISAFLAVFAKPLMEAWIGGSFAIHASAPLRFLAIAALFLGMSGPAGDLARGFGRPALVTVRAAVAAALVIGSAFVVVPSYGAAGAAFCVLLGITLTSIPFILVVGSRVARLDLLAICRDLAGPGSALGLITAIDACGLAVSRSIYSAAITGVAGSALYAAFCVRVILTDAERSTVWSAVVHHRLRKRDVPLQTPATLD